MKEGEQSISDVIMIISRKNFKTLHRSSHPYECGLLLQGLESLDPNVIAMCLDIIGTTNAQACFKDKILELSHADESIAGLACLMLPKAFEATNQLPEIKDHLMRLILKKPNCAMTIDCIIALNELATKDEFVQFTSSLLTQHEVDYDVVEYIRYFVESPNSEVGFDLSERVDDGQNK